MIKTTKISPSDLKTIADTERFKIEEVGNSDTGDIHNELFIKGLMTVDEIVYAVKKDTFISFNNENTKRML